METMKCTSCGETVLSTDKFCKHCGKSIEQIAKCTSCGETVLSTDKFCKQCGKPNEQVTEQKTEQTTETAVAAENPNKEEKEKFKLYSLRSIVAASFLGGPLAAGILVRKNSLNLGYREQEGLIALIVGIIATLLIIILPLEKGSIPALIPFIYAGITYLIVKKLHGKILKTHKEEGGEFYSGWKTLGIALICGVITIAGIFAYYYFTDKDNDFRTSNTKVEQFGGNIDKNSEQQSSIPQNKNEEVYQITATDLYAAYNNNRAAADNKYTGKTLIVTGYIVGIDKDYKGIYYVILSNKGGAFITSTLCYFPANRNSSLTSLQKGQFVSIKGGCVGIGEDFATLPRLNNCSLEVNTTQPQSNQVNDEQTEYYKYYNYQTWNGDVNYWKNLNVKIIFGKKEITVVYPDKTNTFIIVGGPKSEEDTESGGISYTCYYSNDPNKKTISIYLDGWNGTSISIENSSSEYFTNDKPTVLN